MTRLSSSGRGHGTAYSSCDLWTDEPCACYGRYTGHCAETAANIRRRQRLCECFCAYTVDQETKYAHKKCMGNTVIRKCVALPRAALNFRPGSEVFFVDNMKLGLDFVSTGVFPVRDTPPLLHTHSFIYHPRCIMFTSQYFSFPCQYHSTIAPYSFIHLPLTMSTGSFPGVKRPGRGDDQQPPPNAVVESE
jgi:hypothetical protein